VLSGVWNLNYAGGIQNAVAKAVLEGWSISGIVSYQSGQPYTALINGDFNNDGNRANDRAPGVARNTLRLPSQTSIDPRITRDIPLFGGTHIQLIAEAFNLTNRSNITNVRKNQFNFTGDPTKGGTLTPVSTNPLNGFQSPSAVAGPRTYQFAGKILF